MIRHALVRTAFALVACGLLVAACQQREAVIEDLYRRAGDEMRVGRYTAAEALAAQADGRARHGGGAEWCWRTAILRAEVAVLKGNVSQAETFMTETPAGLPTPATQARAEKVRGYLALKKGAFDQAARRLAGAEELARGSGSAGLLIELKILAGRLLWDRGDRDLADDAYREAVELARARGDRYFEAAALNNRGYHRIHQERYDRALPLLWSAHAAAEAAGASSLAAVALTNLGRCYYRLGDFQRSRELLEKGAAILEQLKDFAFLQNALGQMGDNLLQIGDLPRARTYLERASRLARQHAAGRELTWIRNLAALELEASNWEAASRYHDQAMSMKPGARDRGIVPDLLLDRAAILRARADDATAESIYTRVLDHPDATNQARLDAEAGLARLNLDLGRFEAADRFFARARTRIEQARTSLDTVEHRLSFLSSLVKVHRDYVERLVDRGRTSEALAVVEGTRARVLAERFGGDQVAPADGDLRTKARSRGELLLSYWVAPQRSHLWAVTSNRIEHFLLPGETELRALVEAAQASIARGLRDPRRLEGSPAQQLYQLLLGPVSGYLKEGVAVVIAPDGPLHALSFGALVQPGQPARFLAEQVTLAIAPSLTMLPAQRSLPLDDWSGPVMAIGDPVTGEKEFPPLAKAGLELDSLERNFQNARVQIFRGEAAQPDLLRSMKRQRLSILHFAAHAVANPGSPLDSTIVLSPGAHGNRFSAREALELGIGAEVVTLSACRSALARSYFGEGPVGLAWAFLSGGSAHVVAGLWDVPDESTAQLMERFYSGLRAGQAVPEALQQAQLSLINSPGSDRLPYHWAPFVVYLGPRRAAAPRADLRL